MSGTNGSLGSDVAGGLMLPAPVVRAGKLALPFAPYRIIEQPPSQATSARLVNFQNPVSVSTHGMSFEIMNNQDKYLPQLELMRYVRKRGAVSGRFGRSFQNNGYVHPSHGPGPSGNGSHTHGGLQTKVTALTQSLRPTEWAAGDWGTEIDVTQGMLGFLHFIPVTYRDAIFDEQVVEAPVPSGSSSNRRHGKRFPYAGIFRPAYYKFRWSIIDPTDERGQRIHGPLSETVSVTSNKFPFLPEDMYNDGGIFKATCSINPGYSVNDLRAWIGAVSRIP